MLTLACVLPVVLTACTVGPSNRPAVLQQDSPGQGQTDDLHPPQALPPIGEQGTETIAWSPCDEGTRARLGEEGRTAASDSLSFSCATITSGQDAPELPDSPRMRLSVLKAGADNDKTVPLVVVNDINGEPGTLFAARLATRLPAELRKRFSIIGFDRRGTGDSDAIDCIPPEARADLVGVDPAGGNAEALRDAVRTAGQECAIALGNAQLTYNSLQTAGDLEQLRIQLAVPRLNAIARGDGSRSLAAYADRFRNKVGRVVLDGAPDPTRQAETALEGVAEGVEATLDAFADDCTAGKCPLGENPRDAIASLLTQLRSKPLSSGDGIRVGPSFALHAIWAGLAEPERWSTLAAAIAEARQGKPDRLAAFAIPLIDYADDAPPTIDAVLATTCNDTVSRLPAQQVEKLAEEWRSEYPMFGGLIAQQLVWCGQWPVRSEPLPDPKLPGTPPMMLISTAADPRTPEQATTRAADQLSHSPRIAWHGAGQGAAGRSACVDDKITAFLVNGKIARDGVACPA